ncbi:hypothetical protein GGQ80_001927 [Sphingomonas jinjuensis]|uniref:PRC-barrel domain-containing protein n=1 Tax=Sphingomonas jinjuensis TaxID=535907 RepID=A0A840FEH6_9SPHN|nr:hypothetical protein [Sphingomonas jinjuensis]MBB4154017.1 hypothetical protein [Sphingomonas jinjuensis]
MKYMAVLALGAMTAVPAMAQTAPAQTAPATTASAAPTVGATIYDSAGVAIGQVTSVTADAAVVNTGTAQVALPLTSIGKGPSGPSIAMTKAALDAAAAAQQQQAKGALQSRLVAGTQVKGRNAQNVIGTIKSADAANVIVTASNGRDVQLPVSGFSAAPDGSIIIGLTAEQFNAAAGTGATASTGATAPGATAATDTTAAAGADTASTTTTTKTTSTTKKKTR